MNANNQELGQFILGDWGQNLLFNAYMAKLMECLGDGFNGTIKVPQANMKAAAIA